MCLFIISLLFRCLDAKFVSDTSYSDDAIISYGNAFKKGWIIENTGTKTWKRVKLVHQDGFRPEEPEIEVPDLEPGMQVNSSIYCIYLSIYLSVCLSILIFCNFICRLS